MHHRLTILGIESSCDDTAAAIISHAPGEAARVHASVIFGQAALHGRYGGVVPEIAARAHAEALDYCTEECLEKAGTSLNGIDAIAVTAGPGLIGGLMSGVAFAKGLAAGSAKPLLGINHLAGHALTPRFTHGVQFPYLALLASGGHCQFLVARGPNDFLRLGGTIDDAPGEAFDKSARLLGLEQPGGPSIERVAAGGDPKRFRFPRPLRGRQGCNMSFSGLKTALLRTATSQAGDEGKIPGQAVADISASFQYTVADILAEKTEAAFRMFEQATGKLPGPFAVTGGVAANMTIRRKLEGVCDANDVAFVAPHPKYCTDNGAMIAWAGLERFRLGLFDDMTLGARPRWPLDTVSPPLSGSGKKGAKS